VQAYLAAHPASAIRHRRPRQDVHATILIVAMRKPQSMASEVDCTASRGWSLREPEEREAGAEDVPVVTSN
jgi:hypothetical protein